MLRLLPILAFLLAFPGTAQATRRGKPAQKGKTPAATSKTTSPAQKRRSSNQLKKRATAASKREKRFPTLEKLQFSIGRGVEVRQTRSWRYFRTNQEGHSVETTEADADYVTVEFQISSSRELASFIIGASTTESIVVLGESNTGENLDPDYGNIDSPNKFESTVRARLDVAHARYVKVLPPKVKKQIQNGRKRVLVISTHGNRQGELTGIGPQENVTDFIRGMVSAYDRLVPASRKDTRTIPLIDACYAGSSCRLLGSEFPNGILIPKVDGTYAHEDLAKAEKDGGEFFQLLQKN